MDAVELTAIRRAIDEWYAAKHRSFPWRGTRDPWAILVSEVMLQQTQASRVAERFGPFLDRFPTPASMATARPAEVLAAWSGLGYNGRALSLHRTAVAVARNGWPRTVDALSRLPGIGPYTARAVASLAFGIAVGPVDTNVRRWLTRRLELARPTSRGLQDLADALAAIGSTDPDRVAAWTHATMEFGARICTPRIPGCHACPIAHGCPSRGAPPRIPAPRQPAYAGSGRALRGAIVRWLSQAPDHMISTGVLRRRLRDSFDPPAWNADVTDPLRGLERAGLIHRGQRTIHLGPSGQSSVMASCVRCGRRVDGGPRTPVPAAVISGTDNRPHERPFRSAVIGGTDD